MLTIVKMYQLTLLISIVGLGVSGLPANHTLKNNCLIYSYDQVKGLSNCDVIHVSSFRVPAKTTLIFDLKKGAQLTFTGQIIWEYSGYWDNGYLMEIFGDAVTVTGASGHLFHGQGEKYWNGKVSAGKPTFVYIRGTGSNYHGLKFKNCPERCVALDGSHTVVLDGFNIDNSEGTKLGHNTDGFDVARSSYVTIQHSTVIGQDDCVAINSGNFILINYLKCIGTHGFDIAVGQGFEYDLNVVHDITFANSVLSNGACGLHILSCNDGGNGRIYNIVYKNIQIQGASVNGIIIQQDFSNAKQGPSGTPKGNVPISNVTISGVTGYMNGKYSSAVQIICAACSDFNFKGVSITGAKNKNQCSFKPKGFDC